MRYVNIRNICNTEQIFENLKERRPFIENREKLSNSGVKKSY